MHENLGYERQLPPAVSEQARVAADEDDNLDDVKELAVADYLVFLLSVDTYMRWQVEGKGAVDAQDPVLISGLALLRRAERASLDAIAAFLKSNLTSPAQIKVLEAGLRPPPSADGAAIRALKFRTVLSRGGASTAKAVFGTSNKARKEALDALDAARIDDPDAALARLSAIVLKNKLLESWIDKASEVAVPGTIQLNPVQEATKGAADAAAASFAQQVKQESRPGRDESGRAADEQAATLARVEADAKEAAQKAMAKSGEEDRPITRSEAIAVATSVAVAVTSDPAQEKNVPPALRKLDPEQRAAALTNGRVRVAAGAGSGKSTTLVARVAYLTDGGVQPQRILATSFNKKAAAELRFKIAKKVGSASAKSMTVGTMHGTFLGFITQYGTPEEKAIFEKKMIPNPAKRGDMIEVGGLVNDTRIIAAVLRAWKECYGDVTKDAEGNPVDVPPNMLWKVLPKAGRMKAYLNKFQGQGWSLQEAQAWAKAEGARPEMIQACMFYEMYEGFKGALGAGWAPRKCIQNEPPKAYTKFVREARGGKARVGDFNDMLVTFRNMLRRDPAVKAKVQSAFDHILVDECQDLNPVQFEVFMLMTEHIDRDAEDKSFWMVGDDKQSIYAFRGSDPQLFIDLEDNGFKSRQMTTNYRCAPEFVHAANQLIANNENQIPMEAKASPTKAMGQASLRVESPTDTTAAAFIFGNKVKRAMVAGEPMSDFAVLARTNAELHDFETACIIRGVPYVRKGSASFFGSPESATFLSFVDFIASDDPQKLQENLSKVLINSGRLFYKGKPEELADALKGIFSRYCVRNGIDIKSFNPIVHLIQDYELLAQVTNLFTGSANPENDWKVKKDANLILDLIRTLADIRGNTTEDGYTTKDLFEDILRLDTVDLVLDETGKTVRKTISLKERLTRTVQSKVGDDDSDETAEGDAGEEPLGSILFFYEMLEPDPTEPDLDPTKPHDFVKKLDRFRARAKDLRIDPVEWDKLQKDVPLDQQTKPPGVYMGTVHSVKGAEWEDVTVMMPKGKFPSERMPRKPEKNTVPEEQLVSPEEQLESERRLGYVALTRAIKDMTILCPKIVNGKPAGVSPFVGEAGLAIGENVKKATPSEPDAIPPRPEEMPAEEPIDATDDFGAYLSDEGVEPEVKQAAVKSPSVYERSIA